jgi:hypothetical protein
MPVDPLRPAPHIRGIGIVASADAIRIYRLYEML